MLALCMLLWFVGALAQQVYLAVCLACSSSSSGSSEGTAGVLLVSCPMMVC